MYVLSSATRGVDRYVSDLIWQTVYPDTVAGISLDRAGALVVTFYAQQINAMALSTPGLWVDGTYYEPAAPINVQLLPGSHYLEAYGGDLVSFTVAEDGTIDYDASLDGILSGRGTQSLTVNGLGVTVDATALSTPGIWVDSKYYDPSAAQALQLLPGSHYLEAYGGDIVSFTVTADGTVDYDAALDGAMSGRGTATLTLSGLSVTADATALSGPGLWVDSAYYDSAAAVSLRLLPGKHCLQTYAGDVLYVTVNADGTIDYDAALDGRLTGRGTTTLTLTMYWSIAAEAVVERRVCDPPLNERLNLPPAGHNRHSPFRPTGPPPWAIFRAAGAIAGSSFLAHDWRTGVCGADPIRHFPACYRVRLSQTHPTLQGQRNVVMVRTRMARAAVAAALGLACGCSSMSSSCSSCPGSSWTSRLTGLFHRNPAPVEVVGSPFEGPSITDPGCCGPHDGPGYLPVPQSGPYDGPGFMPVPQTGPPPLIPAPRPFAPNEAQRMPYQP